MANKDFIYQRLCIYAGKEFDPTNDQEVVELLRYQFNIHLPQRASMNDSLEDATSDHEIIRLILQYRNGG
ncbi:MAG: hypothetical protein ACRBB6_04635 [Neptuniibacter sp.]